MADCKRVIYYSVLLMYNCKLIKNLVFMTWSSEVDDAGFQIVIES